MEKSAVLLTVVVWVALLFPGTRSVVVLATLAVFESGPAVPTGTCTFSVNDAVVTANIVQVQVMVPVPPLDGRVQGLVGVAPPVKSREMKVVPVGTASVKVTFCATAGPLLVMTIG